jgi:VIT1/CCC1 family predicted Fe2+/Mn2+ transporter
LKKEDWLGALGVFLLVFLSTLPVVIPFTFMKNIALALRVSNGIAILMLFLTGYAFGKAIGDHPVLRGVLGIVLGAVLVSFTIALGG